MGILRVDKISGLETPTAVTGSVDFDGNDHLSIGNPGNFNFLHNGTTDWTVEFWAKSGTATRQFVWGTGGSSAQTGFYLQIMSAADAQSDATGVFALVGRGASGNYIGWGADNCLTLNTWHHIAAVFKSSDKTLALYVDGQEVDNDAGTVSGTFAAANYSSSDSSYAFIVGKNQHGGGNYMNGEISNLRVVAGHRLYTSDFTPPVHALETINGTRILCCNNPDSVTAVSNAGIESTPIATASGDPTVATDNPSLTRDFTSGTEFKGVTTFDTQGYFVPPSGTTEQRNLCGTRGLFIGGFTPSPSSSNIIDYITIASMGNAQDFGDCTINAYTSDSCSSYTRAVTASGFTPTILDETQFVTIATTGNSIAFGELSTTRYYPGALSSSTRGIWGGGSPANSDVIDYVTIASIGDAVDFGNLTVARTNPGGCSSPTRGIFYAGQTSPTVQDTIDYITIATTGNATDFGNATQAKSGVGACSNSTRAVAAGGFQPTNLTEIDYITIATLGNAQDFGDLNQNRKALGSTASPIRGVFGGGYAPGFRDEIEYVQIMSTGNAKDFGDLTAARDSFGATSNGHGGLS